jgi:xylulose-5-phosphate/fructose-6-phosphate phosphoketolase
MPGEVIDRPNPQPLASQILNNVLGLAVKLEKVALSDASLKGLEEFRRASNYIAAGNLFHSRRLARHMRGILNRKLIEIAMIFLSDNALIERDLTFDDIKPRLLGHWDTCPGLTLAYAHLNYLTSKNNLDLIYVVEPGHGASATLASLWLEGSLEKFYPEYSQTKQGLHNLITGFSTPRGFPSHINAETPGSIHGGGVGYDSVAWRGEVSDYESAGVYYGDGEGSRWHF